MYNVRVIKDEAGFRTLEADWDRLALRSKATTIFSSYPWAAAWWRWFGRGAALRILAAYEDAGILVGLAPLIKNRVGPFRRLQYIGTGLGDAGDVLADLQHATPALTVLLEAVRMYRRDWDLADCQELPPASPLVSHLAAVGAPGLRTRLAPQTPCFLLVLPSSWEAYVAGLVRKRRYYVTSFPRRFLHEHNGRCVVVTEPSAVVPAVDLFVELQRARWAAKGERLSPEHYDPRFAPFLRDVCARCADRGWLRIMQLFAGDRLVASSINFLFQGRWHAYMKAFDPDWAGSRPGTVLDALRIRAAIAEGAREFDFGRGDEAYKSGFGGAAYQTARLVLANGGPRSRLAFALLGRRLRPGTGADSASMGHAPQPTRDAAPEHEPPDQG